MRVNHKIYDPAMLLYWHDLPRATEIYVIRTKRKTAQLSMTHQMQIIARVPKDLPIETVRKLVFERADAFKHHAMITALR